MQEPNWNNDNRKNGEICLSNAKKVYRDDPQSANDYVDDAISYFIGDESSLCDLAQCYYIKAYLLRYVYDCKEESKPFYVQSIITHILGSKRNSYKTHKFYKFVGVNIDNLHSVLNRIRLLHPSGFNDPLDCPIAIDSNKGIPDIDLFKGLRVGCFGVVDDTLLDSKKEYYLDASKWSYYGDSHRGICVEYDFSELEFSNQYALMGKIKYEKQYNSTKGIVGSGLLTKSEDYKLENEWRIIWYDESLITNEPKYIDIRSSMITKIYLGYKCPKEIQEHILQFRDDNPHIDVYKVQPSEENFYQLETLKL